MISQIRKAYNEEFTSEKYQTFLEDIHQQHNHVPPFRIAETPIFVSKKLKHRIIEACEEITDSICQADFKEKTQGALDMSIEVPNEDEHTLFLQMDFGICKDENGDLIPKLIEVQGFPSLYFFQDLLANAYRRHFYIPEGFQSIFGVKDFDEYRELMREVIVGNSNPENVVLLEIEPKKQLTQIDFWETEQRLGIKILCVTEVLKEGKKLYYLNEKGEKIHIEKIYYRVIFDELLQRNDLKRNFSFKDDLDVEWLGHPNWFYRISKYTMPYLESQYVPKTHFVGDLEGKYPEDLENYVLKPLYSFAGSGVKFHVKKSDLEEIPTKHLNDYILQEKVTYEPVLEAPDGNVKCEIRMLMLWKKEWDRPRLVNNLARLSKGEMIGVRFNKDKEWVGASVGFFEE